MSRKGLVPLPILLPGYPVETSTLPLPPTRPPLAAPKTRSQPGLKLAAGLLPIAASAFLFRWQALRKRATAAPPASEINAKGRGRRGWCSEPPEGSRFERSPAGSFGRSLTRSAPAARCSPYHLGNYYERHRSRGSRAATADI